MMWDTNADGNVDLSEALEFAERAVSMEEKSSHEIQLTSLMENDLGNSGRIGFYWDTLGWVEFRLGHLDRAEEYLRAAWLLTQAAITGDHLGQVYEKEKKTDQAIHMYRLAVATPEGKDSDGDEAREHLSHLGVQGGTNDIYLKRGTNSPGDELSKMRTVKLKSIVPGTATAEFFLLVRPGPKITDVSFISGSEKLKRATDALEAAKFEMPFPTGSAAILVRRVIVMCSSISGCQAVLYVPSSVNSVQ